MGLRKGNRRKKTNGSGSGERLPGIPWRLVLRRLGTGVLLAAIGWSAGAGWEFLGRTGYLKLKTIVVTGNRRLGEEDIRRHLPVGRENLLMLDLKEVGSRLREAPWIRSLRLRKQLPDTLLVDIREKMPLALLEKDERFALLDQDGREIELLPRGQVPFLPVVRGGRDRETVSPETLALLRALRETGVADGRETVEVENNEQFGLVLTIDGLATRMGQGDFAGKLARWASVEGGIRNSGMRVDYVDVRFNDRVVVRQIKVGTNNG